MANKAKIKVEGLKEAKAFIIKTKKDIVRGEEEGITNAAFFVQGEVKQSIAGRRNEPRSVDTGRFLNSPDVKKFKEKKEVNATIFSTLPYARKLEDGTTKFAGRHHFRNTANRNKAKVAEIIDKAIKKNI